MLSCKFQIILHSFSLWYVHYILSLVQQVRHMFDEIDYVLEGKNAERFATLYSHGEFWNTSFIQFLIIVIYLFHQIWSYNTCSSQAYGPFACWQLTNTVNFLGCSGGDTSEGSTSIKVPKVYWSYTRKSILTLEWIDGIKLTDAEGISKANLNRKRMIDEVLLNCFVAVNWILVLVLLRLSSTLSLSLLWF